MAHCLFGWPVTAGLRVYARRMCCLFTLTLASAGLAPHAHAQTQENYEALAAFTSLLDVIRSEYVDSVTVTYLVRAAMDGVVRSLDPYSRLVPREAIVREVALERGDLGTLGMTLEAVDGLPTVLSVVDRGPAERGGILAGDRVVGVNDTSVVGADVGSLVLRLARPPGTRVALELERGPRMEPERYRVTIRTAVVHARSVTRARMLDDSIGYVRLADFRPGAPEELADAVDRLRRQHATGLVLDLRGNPGGRVTASVEIAALFLPRHTVVFRTRSRRTADRDFATVVDGPFRGVPMVVLTDEHTASAAEALTGSLQDHDRALVVGGRTSGKALILEPFVLSNGDVVWLTAGRVLTPNGRFIQRPYVTGGPAGHQVVPRVPDDSAAGFPSDAGRPLSDGWGIQPDVPVPGAPAPPGWFSVAVDRGLTVAVADSVAAALPASDSAREAWMTTPERWDREVTTPFLARARALLGIPGTLAPEVRTDITRRLAGRVVEVWWGEGARDEFLLQYDPAVRVAAAQFAGLPTRLVPSNN